MSINTCSSRTVRRFHSPAMTIRWCRRPSTSGADSSRQSATASTRSKSSTASCLKARGRRPAWVAALARLFSDPAGAIRRIEDPIHEQQHEDAASVADRTATSRDSTRQVQAFVRQLADFMQIEVLNQQGQFRFLRRLLNYDDWRVAGRPKHTQFLDYQVVNSNLEAERDHLRVGDHFVRVLTMKEAIAETRPLVLDSLLEDLGQFLRRHRMGADYNGESAEGSKQAPPPLQCLEDRLHFAVGK